MVSSRIRMGGTWLGVEGFPSALPHQTTPPATKSFEVMMGPEDRNLEIFHCWGRRQLRNGQGVARERDRLTGKAKRVSEKRNIVLQST